ncbi:MAG: hypothetical protein JJU45_08140 [Acidimicrobiia bacterium]|nr:hypothetical protein [Acidimicrobiia bacterium]
MPTQECYFIEQLNEAIAEVRSPEQIEIRPMLAGTGRWIRLRSTRTGLEAQLWTNTYYLPNAPLPKEHRSLLQSFGWEVTAPDRVVPATIEATKSFPRRATDSVGDELTDMTERMFVESADQIDVTCSKRNPELVPVPPVPHALVSWDFDEDCPIEQLNFLMERVHSADGRLPKLLDVEIGDSMYSLVIVGAPLSHDAGVALWTWCVAEWPRDGGADVCWGC